MNSISYIRFFNTADHVTINLQAIYNGGDYSIGIYIYKYEKNCLFTILLCDI